MIDAKTIERLHNSEDFLAFLEEVYESRESYVRNLHDLPTDRIQQASGQICAFDKVCQMGQLELIRAKWRKVRE